MGESIMVQLAFGKALHLLLLITSTPPTSPKHDELKKDASNLIHQHNKALSQYLEYKEGDK